MNVVADDTYKVVINSCNKKKSTVDRLNEQLVKIEKDMTARLDLIETNNNKLAVSCRPFKKKYFRDLSIQ